MVNKADEQLELEANETLPLQLRASMAAHYPPPAPSSGGGVPGVTSSSLPGVAGACMGTIGAMGVRVGGVGQSTLTKPLPPLPSIASLPRHQHSLSGQHPHGSGSSRGSPPKQPQQHIYQDSQLGESIVLTISWISRLVSVCLWHELDVFVFRRFTLV